MAFIRKGRPFYRLINPKLLMKMLLRPAPAADPHVASVLAAANDHDKEWLKNRRVFRL
jgi:hypothetical protein